MCPNEHYSYLEHIWDRTGRCSRLYDGAGVSVSNPLRSIAGLAGAESVPNRADRVDDRIGCAQKQSTGMADIERREGNSDGLAACDVGA